METKLSAKDFYKNAKKAKLTSSQFYFNARHPYANVRKKLPYLKRLPELTNDMVCILKEMQTVTIIYKLSVTNLEFTLGLTENTDVNGKKINDFFLPMSLRVEDTSVEKSNDGEIVDFIFSKDASIAKYDTLLVEDNAYFQEANFFVTAHGHVNVLVPKICINKYVGCFMASSIKKMFFYKYGFSDMCTQKVLKQEVIVLPVKKDASPDWEYMEEYMKKMEKTAVERMNLLI